MPWGERMAPAVGTTGQICDALAALRAVGITEDNLAMAAMAAAGRIACEPERVAEALRRHRCQEDTGGGAPRSTQTGFVP